MIWLAGWLTVWLSLIENPVDTVLYFISSFNTVLCVYSRLLSGSRDTLDSAEHHTGRFLSVPNGKTGYLPVSPVVTAMEKSSSVSIDLSDTGDGHANSSPVSCCYCCLYCSCRRLLFILFLLFVKCVQLFSVFFLSPLCLWYSDGVVMWGECGLFVFIFCFLLFMGFVVIVPVAIGWLVC